jgi:hypothetical protein
MADQNKFEAEKKRKQEVKPGVVCQLCELNTDIVSRCRQCNIVLCKSCDRVHKKLNPAHKNVTIAEDIEEIKKKVRTTEGKCEQLIQSSKSILNKLVKNKITVVNKKKSAIKTIECSRQEMISKINDYHDGIIRSINVQVDEISRSITDEESKVNTTCITLEQARSKLKELITSGNNKSILNDAQSIQDSVEKGRNMIFIIL